MSRDPEIPEGPAQLLAALREPMRLRILLALEREPRSAVDLQRDLGLSYEKVTWALNGFRESGLIERRPDVRSEAIRRGGRGADIVVVYGTVHTGWKRILKALQAVADSTEQT